MHYGKRVRQMGMSLVCLVVLVLPVQGADAPLASWPHWRGPSGQGYSEDTRVPLTWSETTNLLWKMPLPGHGNSTPIVWGDRIFLTAASANGKERYVLCVRAGDGKILWQKVAAVDPQPAKSHAWNRYASASCTTDGNRVYAFFGTPGLFCYDFDGNLIWKHPFGMFTSETGWGTAASPFLHQDLVIQNCDNDGPKFLPPGAPAGEAAPMALIALDKATGQERWRAVRNQGRGFSTPVLVPTPQGRLDLVLNGPLGVWAYDPATGKEVWHCERVDKNGKDQARFGEPVPVFNRDTLFAPSGRPGPFQAVRLGGSGDISQTGVRWEVVRKGHRDVASPILWGDSLYMADNKGVLTCYDLQTGQARYNERLGAKVLASPVAVRGKVLFVQDDGVTVVIEPGRQFKVVGRNKLGEGKELDFVASPAIAAGRLYLRSQSHLYCIGEKK